MSELTITETSRGARISIWAKPRSARSGVLGVREGALEVALAAPPVDGAANSELVATLAKALGVRKRDVVVRAGHSGRNKVVEVLGRSPSEVRAALTR